jgi:cellulose biosynthesis protein BcsQ
LKRFREAGFDRDYAFVDTPGSIMPIITDPLEAADLVVVPVQPGQLDFWGQNAAVDQIERLLARIRPHDFTKTRICFEFPLFPQTALRLGGINE